MRTPTHSHAYDVTERVNPDESVTSESEDNAPDYDDYSDADRYEDYDDVPRDYTARLDYYLNR